MKVAVVGFGRMGHEVDAVLRDRGHETACVDLDDALPQGCAVGIDFTQADAVLPNVRRALDQGMRYVVGTTGWQSQMEEVRAAVVEAGGGLVHAANFSLGVNLYYRIVRQAARVMAHVPDYDPYVIERHHRGKRDAPSGTALSLARILEQTHAPRQPETALSGPLAGDRFHVSAVRAGGIVGDHTVGFDSGIDEILIEHRARTRRGFAVGAVMAAEWIATRSGVHAFDEVLTDLLGPV